MDLKVFHRVDNRRQMTQNWPARKSPRAPLRRNGSRSRSRHSLVTPIDWKPGRPSTALANFRRALGRHSLVTPIDWKLTVTEPERDLDPVQVAILW